MRFLYRAMRETPDGTPEIAPDARSLGVRPNLDIPVVHGIVQPGTGGLSVAPDDVLSLPPHRRTPRLGGRGEDPVWEIRTDQLGGDLGFRQDKINHGLIEPSRGMTLDALQRALAETAPM